MNNFQLKTSVVFIIFNRPETTEKVFEAIRRSQPPKLFVIADGPRHNRPQETEKCAAARAIINRVDWRCEIFTNYSQINLGCRQRVYSGLNWVFDIVESAIILEDDCVPHPSFFQFCEELLEKYRGEERIKSISGDNFQFGNHSTESSYYFSRYPHCWGWATWRRAWQDYDDKISLWPQLRGSNWLENLLPNAEAVRYWSSIFDNYEKFNSWAYIWLFSCWSRNGLTILPEVNLVSNIGFHQEATHTSSPSKFAKMGTEAISFPLKHPTSIIANIEADNFTEKIMFSGSSKLAAGAIATVECKVCGSTSRKFDRAQILNKYEVDYFQCDNCGFVQTETPYWLAEAYAQPIASSDVGLVTRNIELSLVAENLILNLFDRSGKFIDYGCGYGLFVRLMRESGFDCYGYDRYCQNIFYRGFEAGKNLGEKYELVAAFEVLEHLVNPLEEIENILQFSRNLFFSTKLLPDYNPKPKDWWYYALSEGQHISIYTKEALCIIAKKFNLNFYSYGGSLHLLTEKKIDPNLFPQLCQIEPRRKKAKQLREAEYLQEIEAMKNPAPTEKKLKVLVDGVFFQLNNTGIARVWRSLLTAWVEDGFAGNILVLDRGETAPKITGITYRKIPPYDYAKTESDRHKLQQICEEEKADLFISTYYTTPLSAPSVFMAYDMVPEAFGQNLNHPEWREKHEGIRRAVSYITISENTARDLIKYFPNISSSSVAVAPCGVDAKFSPASNEEIANLKSKYGILKPYFLVVGERVGWQNYKNAILLFQAFYRLQNNREFEIVCVGGKSVLEPELERYVSENNVRIVRLTDEELKAAYSGATALVYPSKYEGFGMPIVEAMACGCPVITCKNSSLPEVAGNAAIYVSDRDVNSLVNALVAVQKPEVRQQLIAAGLERSKNFSWSKMAKIVSSALQQTANKIAAEKTKVNEAQLALQREFWNVDSIDKAMFGRVLAYEGIEKLSPEEKKEVWEKSIQTWTPQILRGIPAKPEWKILEIGCGVGRLVKHFRESYARVDGVDISENTIEFAKQYLADGKQNGAVYVNNGCDLQQLPDESYDFVYSTIVFQHIRSVSIVKSYFSETFRVLKPGGYFRIQVHDRSAKSLGNFDEEGSPDKQYYFSGNAYTDEQLKQLLLEAGFNLVSLECSKPWIWATVRRANLSIDPPPAPLNKGGASLSSSPLIKGGRGGSSPSSSPLIKGGRGGSPKVSAIISTYNSQKFLRGCLEDLVKQTLYQKGELEIIIIDSASQQQEGAIASEFQTKYANIIYHRTAERERIYAAWNRGIKLAKGEYITNANTDDRHRPDALETLANYLDNNPETSVVYADQLITEIPNETWETTKANKRWNWPEFNYEELEKRCIIGPQPMWRKSLHEKSGYFREEFSVAGDYEFWLRVGKSEKIVRLPEILGLYYNNQQGLEKTAPKLQQELATILKDYGIFGRGIIRKTSVPAEVSSSEIKNLPYGSQTLNKVSVIIPCYNHGRFLTEAVESVLGQSYQNWECLIIDDGSEDNSNEIARQLIAKHADKKITLLPKSNSGVVESRNLGMRKAKGEFILFLDADDKIHPHFIAETLAVLQANPQVGFVYTDIQEFGVKNKLVSHGDFQPNLFLQNNQVPVTSLFRKEVGDRVGGFKKIVEAGWEDWEFWISAYECGWQGYRLPKPYLYYRQHSGGSRLQNLSSSQLSLLVQKALIVSLHPGLYGKDEVLRSREILQQHSDRRFVESPQLPNQSPEVPVNPNSPEKTMKSIQYPQISPAEPGPSKPFWSITIPTYNGGKYLEQTLRSVLEQHPEPAEVQIEVLDDRSTEGDIEAMVEKIGGGRVSFYRQPQNLGFVGNWNACIERARGEWVHILHQDDLVLPGFYDRLRQAIERDGTIGAAFCRHYYIDGGGKERSLSPLEGEKPGIIENWLERIAIVQRVQFPSIVVKRSVYEALGGFSPEAGYAADWEMWKRIAAYYPVWYEPQPLACWRMHSASASVRAVRQATDAGDIRKAIEISESYLPPAKAKDLSQKAREHYALYAVNNAKQLLMAGEEKAAIAQIRESLITSSSTGIKESIVALFAPEAETRPQLDLEALLREIVKESDRYQKPKNKEAIASLQRYRQQLANLWLSLTSEELENAYNSSLGKAHQTLLNSGLKNELLTKEEKTFVEGIKTYVAKGFYEPKAIQYLLAGMLYRRADQLEINFIRAPIPKWFATDYLNFLFDSPRVFQELGDVDNYARYFEKLLVYIRDNIVSDPDSQLWQNIALLFAKVGNFIPAYFANFNLKNIYSLRGDILEFVAKKSGSPIDYVFSENRVKGSKIRLGIVNEHFTPQSETYSTIPAFEYLDREKFEIILYAVRANNHPLEEYCRSRCDRFVVLPNNTASQVETIRRDNLDILITGTNVTAMSKPVTLLMLHRMAPTQATLFSSPVTTGMRNIDYYISGELSETPDSPSHYREKLALLEGTGFCFNYYAVKTNPPQVKPQRSSWNANNETVIFISGANFYKIIPELGVTWAKILARVPNSILVLYPFAPSWSRAYPGMAFLTRMQETFAEYGVEKKRLVAIKALPSRADVKECLEIADIYLDSFPYAGSNSLVDPLEMGLPAVVMDGENMRSKQGAAMLRSLGISDLIADSEESYIDLAVRLATNSGWRLEKRAEIKAKMQQNPPFLDSRGYSEKLGALLEGWLAAGTGETPVLREVQNRRTGVSPVPSPVPEARVQAALSSEFLKSVMGSVNLYEIEPGDDALVGELRQLRLELAAFWMGAQPEELETIYRGEMRQAYQAFLASGFQSETLTEDERGFLQHLTEVSTGLSQPKAVNALLGAMLYFPPGKMRVRDAASRLPQWLLEDYEEVFENLSLPSGDPPRPPLKRGEEEEDGNPPRPPLLREEEVEDGNPPRPPLVKGEEEVEDGNPPRPPFERGEQEEELPVELKFLNEVLGSVHLYYIDPSDESAIARLRQLRKQMADLCLNLPAEELEGFYLGEIGKGFQALLNSGLQNKPMVEDEVAFLQELAIALSQGIEAPKALNHLLAAMLYCRRGQLQVEDISKLPQWFVEDYQKFATGESPLVVAG